MLVEDEAKVASRVSGVERRVLDFGKLLCESDEKTGLITAITNVQ